MYLTATNCSQGYEVTHSKFKKLILSDKPNACCYHVPLALFIIQTVMWYKQTMVTGEE